MSNLRDVLVKAIGKHDPWIDMDGENTGLCQCGPFDYTHLGVPWTPEHRADAALAAIKANPDAVLAFLGLDEEGVKWCGACTWPDCGCTTPIPAASSIHALCPVCGTPGVRESGVDYCLRCDLPLSAGEVSS